MLQTFMINIYEQLVMNRVTAVGAKRIFRFVHIIAMRTDVGLWRLEHTWQQIDFLSGGKFLKMRHSLLHLNHSANFVLFFNDPAGKYVMGKIVN